MASSSRTAVSGVVPVGRHAQLRPLPPLSALVRSALELRSDDGRPEDWQPGIVDETISRRARALSAAGLRRGLVDRHAYPDNAAEPRGSDREGGLGRAGRAHRTAASPSSTCGPYAGEEREGSQTPEEIETLRSTTLEPLVAGPGPGLVRAVTTTETSAATSRWRARPPSSRLENPSAEERPATLDLAVGTGGADVGVDVRPSPRRTPVGRTHRLTKRAADAPTRDVAPAARATGDTGPGALRVRLFDSGLETHELPPGGVGLQATEAGAVTDETRPRRLDRLLPLRGAAARLPDLAAREPARGEMNVHVVDNASGDGTAEMVRREFPEVRLTPSARRTPASRAANNVAIRARHRRRTCSSSTPTRGSPREPSTACSSSWRRGPRSACRDRASSSTTAASTTPRSAPFPPP